MRSFGIDVSIYQKGINLTQAMAEGVSFVIAKCGGAECGLFKDSQFEYYYASCESLNIPIGTYFYSKCTTPEAAEQEAEYCLNIIKGKKFPCKVWYDIEGSMCTLQDQTLNKIALAFCNKIKNAGYECGVYASLSTFKKIDFDGSFSKKFPKWVAYWGTDKPLSIRDGIDMWQFGGETNMIRSNKIAGKVCDQDYAFFDFEHTAPVLWKPAPANYTLRYGNRGPSVELLQRDLNYVLGTNLDIDGIFGPKTKMAVIQFQNVVFDDPAEHDGIYGPKTYSKMKEAIDNAD